MEKKAQEEREAEIHQERLIPALRSEADIKVSNNEHDTVDEIYQDLLGGSSL